MREWFRNVYVAISTVAGGMWVTMRYWLITYKAGRGTFTEQFEYPEKPVPVAEERRIRQAKEMKLEETLKTMEKQM